MIQPSITPDDNGYMIRGMGPFDCEAVLDGGQCFRWVQREGIWQGYAGRHMAKIRPMTDGIYLECSLNALPMWRAYLDVDSDYISAREVLSKDTALTELIDEYPGIRFLNQPFFECVISFILSANNNVARIKKTVQTLCETFGEPMPDGYAFPAPDILAGLTDAQLRSCGTGYRAPYIIHTAQQVAQGFPHEQLIGLPLDEAREALTQFKGVGVKVADCILLFSLQRKDAFPVDTWIRKVMIDIMGHKTSDNQIRAYAAQRFGEHAGLANQYLFHYHRTK